MKETPPIVGALFGFSFPTDLLEALVLGENRKHVKYAASQASNAPDCATSFEFHRSLALFISEGHSVDIDEGAYSVMVLILFEGGSEGSSAKVAEEAEGS